MKSESFLILHIDSNATTTFKAQKGSKDIIKIVHVTWTNEGLTGFEWHEGE